MKKILLILSLLLTFISCKKEIVSNKYTQAVSDNFYTSQYSWLNENILIMPPNYPHFENNNSEERNKNINKPHQSPF
ncbi:hypothetical protein [uncultured Flavobacterium sp.]|uniref:hypothetical protein n=1 Tax=uncultured Flavobacterium sp. TaxID=165435 RepID=UPI0030C81735